MLCAVRTSLLFGSAVGVVVLVAAGCSNTLETGYKPRALGDSSVKRRAYYAAPFTPEAKAGEAAREQELDMRRPRPGY
jgi:hypothetical protein